MSPTKTLTSTTTSGRRGGGLTPEIGVEMLMGRVETLICGVETPMGTCGLPIEDAGIVGGVCMRG
jgi:hypothetical protein